MKKILVLVFVTMVSTVTFAQVSWNVKAGVNSSSATGLKGTDKDGLESKIGYQIGLGMDYAISEKFSVQPSLLFITKGAKFSYTDDEENDKISIDPIYIELPVMAAYKFHLEDNIKLALSAGPYLAYGIGGKWKEEYTYSGSTDKYKDDVFGSESDVENEDAFTNKRVDFGLGVGAALEVNHFLVSLNASWGLVKLKEYEYSKAKNVCYSLSVGYKF